MHSLIFAIVFMVLHLQSSIGLVPHEISFLVLSQQNKFHSGIAERLRKSIIEQSLNIEKFRNLEQNVFLSNEIFTNEGAWAITPILKHIKKSILKSSTKWLIICEDQSIVNISLLTQQLGTENYTKELFLGYPLHDKEATIIHHFAFFKNPTEFLYPYIRAGVALSVPIIDRLVKFLENTTFTTDFFIDASHEIALFVWNNGQGYRLTPKPYFCSKYDKHCAIYAAEQTTCNTPVDPDRILFAVKTCQKFHQARVPVVQSTWGKYTNHLRIYSDVEDTSIPTIRTNVPNSDTGHCSKTMAIFGLISDEIQRNMSLADIEYIVLIDDDTIISPSALSRFLCCFDTQDDVYLGERYGYNLHSEDGYNYITGGGGIVISVGVLNKLLPACECPSISSPDDMIIAACLQHLDVKPIHSSLFHQARPNDYPHKVLDTKSISFHKHWQIDPYHVYNKWFRHNDHVFFNFHNQPHIRAINKFSNTHIKLEDANKHLCGSDELQSNMQNLKETNIIKHSDL